MAFEPNLGQADPEIQWTGRGRGLSVYLTDSGIDLRVRVANDLHAARSSSGARTLRMTLDGALPFVWSGARELPGKTNYIIGNDPSRWRTNVPHFASAETRRDKKSPSFLIYDSGDNLEYDLRLPAGLDPGKVRLRIAGAEGERLSSDGSLLLTLAGATVTMGRPAIFEDVPGTPRTARHKVSGGFILRADGSVGIYVGPHDPRADLIIDPSISVGYATFLGGSGTDIATSVAIDTTGKVYVAGTTTSASSFPEAPSKSVGAVDGTSEFFIAKIDPTMTGSSSLIYLRFLGGTGAQAGGLIAVDASGDVALTGTTTAADFPMLPTAPSAPTNGLTSGLGNDMVVSELDPTGSQLVFSTFFGGSGTESLNGSGGIALGPGGKVYIASDTSTTSLDATSADLPVTAGAMVATWDMQKSDAFLAIFEPPATAGAAPVLSYCTYLGTNSSGANSVAVGGIAVDASGDAYIAGTTNNSVNGFPAVNAFQSATGAGGLDVFLMKISPLGQGTLDRVYATLLGGSSNDGANAIALDSAIPPNVYVVGTTSSTNFPMSTTTAGYQTTLAPGATSNAFLSVIGENSSGIATLVYSTYLGGTSVDSGQGVALVLPSGNGVPAVYVAGSTTSWNFPWHDNLQPFNGARDAFVAKFNTTTPGVASLIYATPLGGTLPYGLALSGANAVAAESGTGGNHAFVVGSTSAADFPTAVTTTGAGVGGVQQFCSSCEVSPPATSNATDAFVTEINESPSAEPAVHFNVPSVTFSPVAPGTSITSQPLAVMNSGEAPLNISSLQVSGSQDFQVLSQSSACQAPIQPGQTPGCSFDLAFAPMTAGAQHAILLVTDDAPGSPQILELSGSGQGAVALVSPLSIPFGNQPQGTSANTQIVTVTNAGDDALTITGVSEVGDTAEFPLPANSCSANTTLVPSSGTSSCTITVGFVPQSTGPFQASINISDNSAAGSTQQVVTLTGTGTTPTPLAVFNPSSMALGFGSVATTSTSVPQDVTLTNTGSAPLDISGVAITGTNQTEFTMVTPVSGTACPATGGVLAAANPHASCQVGVQFAPQTAGAKTASLTFTDNVTGSPQQIALTGTATSIASLQVAPGGLVFSAQSEGTASAAQVVTLTNNGSSPSSAGGVSLSGSGGFGMQNPCSVVAAGKTCQIGVTFSPALSTAPGNQSGTLNIPGGVPSAISLTGLATQASIALSASFNFGSQLAGTSGTPQPLTITNSSSGPFAGALAVTTATTTPDFSISSDACASSTTAPGGTCTIMVAFSPQPSGSCATPNRSANLTLTDNAPGSPHSIPLSGTATDFCFNAPGGQAIGAAVAPGQAITPYSVQITSSAGFSGTVALSCAATPVSEGVTCGTTPSSVQVVAGTPGQFQVTASTTGPGTTSGVSERGSSGLPAAWRFGLLLPFCLLLGIAAAFLTKSARCQRASGLARLTQVVALMLGFAIGMGALWRRGSCERSADAHAARNVHADDHCNRDGGNGAANVAHVSVHAYRELAAGGLRDRR